MRSRSGAAKRDIAHRITKSPSTHVISSLLVVSSCTRRPVVMSTLLDTEVRTLEWRGIGRSGEFILNVCCLFAWTRVSASMAGSSTSVFSEAGHE